MARKNRHQYRSHDRVQAFPSRGGDVAVFTLARKEARGWVMEGVAFWLKGCNSIRLARDSFPVFQGRTLDELMAHHRGKTRMPHQSNGIYAKHVPSYVNIELAHEKSGSSDMQFYEPA